MIWTGFENYTNDELEKEGLLSSTPLAQELAHRLQSGADSAREAVAEFEAAQKGREIAEEEIANSLEEKHLAETDRLEDKIAVLDEMWSHERTRVTEFYEENKKLREQLEQRKEKEMTLESRLESLENTFSAHANENAARLEKLDFVLHEILDALQRSDTPDPVAPEARQEKPAPANDDGGNATAPVPVPRTKAKPKTVTPATEDVKSTGRDDLKQELLALAAAKGREAALAVIAKHSGGGKTLANIPEAAYAAVCADCREGAAA